MYGDQEKRVKELKRELEGWREAVLPLNQFLIWEKTWYVGVLVAINTFFLLLFWYLDPSVLTTISVIGLFVTLVDYLVPALSASLCRPECWTGLKEMQLEEICRSLAQCEFLVRTYWGYFYEMKSSRPNLYYPVVIVSLAFLAWLGTVINNLLLTYLTLTLVMLLPGLIRHGILEKYFSWVTNALSKTSKNVKDNQVKTKSDKDKQN